MAWLGHEMDYPTLHEPFNTNLENVLKGERVIVKEFPHHITNAGYNLKEVISSFDKVIVHKRLSILDTATSSSYANDNTKLHKTYQITKEWIDDNQTPNWQGFNTAGGSGWSVVGDAQTPDWQAINSQQAPGWSNTDDDQDPNWTDINNV